MGLISEATETSSLCQGLLQNELMNSISRQGLTLYCYTKYQILMLWDYEDKSWWFLKVPETLQHVIIKILTV